MNKLKLIILILTVSCSISSAQEKTLFIGGIAHLGNGEKISNSVISVGMENLMLLRIYQR